MGALSATKLALPTADGIGILYVEIRPDWGIVVREYLRTGDVMVGMAAIRLDCPGHVFAERFDGPTVDKPRHTYETHVEYPQGHEQSRMVRADGWVEARRELPSTDGPEAVTGWHVRGLTDSVDDPRVYRNKREALAAMLGWVA